MSVVACPACHGKLRVPEDLLGTRVRCPTCAETFYAPDDRRDAGPIDAGPVGPASRRSRPDRDRYAGYDEEEDYPRSREDQVPGMVQAISIMTLVGGILAILLGVGALVWFGLGGLFSMGAACLCLFWPGPYYSIILGILATVKGAQLLGRDARRQGPPNAIAIMQIINVINGDIPNCVMGILTLVFLNQPEVRRFFARPRRRPRYEEDY
jgi:predicted Zn finger-like uncharacterized protein